ncbi:MAG: lasso peptide biosynthesis B2 protein [Bryobacteraceae bacterium]
MPRAWIYLVIYDVITKTGGFKAVQRFVERHRTRERAASQEACDAACRAVDEACIWYFHRALCLQRAFVTTCLLRKAGIPAELVIGAKAVPCMSHAWVDLNRQLIYGAHKNQEWFRPLHRI